MITTVLIQLVAGVFKEVHRIRYKDGKTVERIHEIGNPIPEDIREVPKPVHMPQNMHPEYAQYAYHFQMGL